MKIWMGFISAIMALVSLAGLAACGQGAAAGQQTVAVTRGNIVQNISADGELSLQQQRKLSFGVNGKVKEVNVEEGAVVTKGQLLSRLETDTLERALKSAELAIKSAEADRRQAEAGVQSAKADLAQAQDASRSVDTDRKQADVAIKTAEANLKQAEIAVRSAENDLSRATDNFRKITYPYTYSTFALDIPEAIDSISSAERQVGDALKALQAAGLTPDDYARAARQLQQALDNLLDARQRLGRGQGQDVFSSGLFTTGDFWTLRSAQLLMEKSQLGVDTAKAALNVAQLAVDTANNASVKAQLATDTAKSAVDRARAGLGNAEAVLGKAQLAVQKAVYDRDTAQKTMDDANITAPFDGVIAAVNVKTGDILTPADYTRTIFELVDLRRMEFKIKVDEMDIPGVRLGQEASVSIDALPALRPKGKVIFISPLPKIEGGVVQYEVKIAFDAPEGSSLKSGMSSTATIVTGQRSNVLLVNSRAITRDKAGKQTVNVLTNGQLQLKLIETGISNGTDTEVISGLTEGESIIVRKPSG